MPVATDTFRLSTAPKLGSRTSTSQCCRVSWRRPDPSAPITSSVGPRRSTSSACCLAPASAPTTHMPACCKSRRHRARFVTVTTGVVSAAPAATLRALAVRPAARSLGTITARAPQASAVRKQAPKLCGSCTPSSASNKGDATSLTAVMS